jgi:hypothetical protein
LVKVSKSKNNKTTKKKNSKNKMLKINKKVIGKTKRVWSLRPAFKKVISHPKPKQ